MSSARGLTVVGLVGLLAGLGCGGGDEIECGPGTILVDRTCVVAPADAADPSDAGPADAAGPVDAEPPPPPDAAPVLCDPLAAPGQQGCAVGQKCAWVTVEDQPIVTGVIGCVSDGTVSIGGACAQGPAGPATGYDNCAAGGTCIGGTCVDICGFGGGPTDACAAGYDCVRYAGLFANGSDEPQYGACQASCDPLTQQVSGGGTCGAGRGCYVLTNSLTTTAVCATAGTVGHGQPIVGPAMANSCLPGHQPRRADQASTTVECGALCRPADVTSTTNVASEGGVAPETCESRSASPPDSATAGESCRYYWARESFSTLSPYSNTLGWCFKHATFQYDSNEDMVNDAPFPRCVTLTTGDVVPPIGNPMHNDAMYFWCVQLPAMVAPVRWFRPRAAEPQLDRLDAWR